MNPFEIQKSKKQRRSILRSDNQKSKFIKQGKTTVQNVQVTDLIIKNFIITWVTV